MRRSLALHAVAYVSTRGLPFVAAFVAARLLGAGEFGQFVSAISLFMSILLFVDLGLSLTTTTRVARRHAVSERLAGQTVVVTAAVCLFLGLAVSVVLAVGAEPLSRLLFAGEDMGGLLRAGILYVPAAGLASVLTGGLQGLQRYRDLAVIGIAGGLAHIVLVVGLAAYAGPEAALWGAAAAVGLRAMLAAAFLWPLMRRSITSLAEMQPLVELRALIGTALPACVAAGAWAPVHTVLLARLFGHPTGASEAGAFGVALQAFALAMIVPGVLTQFALPRMSGVTGAGAAMRRRAMAGRYALAALGVSVFTCLPVMLFASFFMARLGPDYVEYTGTLALMMAAAMVSAPQGVLSNYMLATGQDWQRVWTKYVWAGVVLATAVWLGLPSAFHASIAYLTGWAVLIAIQALLVMRVRSAEEIAV